MGVNLAEGCGAVNDAPQRAERETRDLREGRDLSSSSEFESPKSSNL